MLFILKQWTNVCNQGRWSERKGFNYQSAHGGGWWHDFSPWQTRSRKTAEWWSRETHGEKFSLIQSHTKWVTMQLPGGAGGKRRWGDIRSKIHGIRNEWDPRNAFDLMMYRHINTRYMTAKNQPYRPMYWSELSCWQHFCHLNQK